MKIPEVLLIEAVSRRQDKTTWELTLEIDADDCSDVFERIDRVPVARLLGRSDRVFTRHLGGKIKTVGRHDISNQQYLRDVYTPGVARVCLAIHDEPAKAREYTAIGNTVAIVTDGTAILGLGDIGPVAGMPVMEGKAALFSQLVGVSGVPILIDTKDPEEIIETVARIAPTFGAIQLEDIAAPGCFEIEARLTERLDIPVLHDDQHGTATVVLAALITASKRAGVDPRKATIGQIGLGAAGLGIVRLLSAYGVGRLLGSDLREPALARLEAIGGERCTLQGVMREADVVIATTGVRGLIKPEMVREGQVILALTNPDPEIEPVAALARGAAFAADGKNVNNVLAFPGLFRGALDAGAKRFTDAMLIAAAETIAAATDERTLVPSPLSETVHRAVAGSVHEAALAEGEAIFMPGEA
eukprot:g5415.t1